MNDKKTQPSAEYRVSVDWHRYYELLRLDEIGQSEVALSGLRQLLASAESRDEKSAILVAVAACLRNLGRAREARSALAEVRHGATNNNATFAARAMMIEAALDIDDGKWSEALSKLDDLKSTFPDFLNQPEEQDTLADLERKRGIALYELHRPREASPLLELAATHNEERATVFYYLGRCRYDLGNLEGAKQAFRDALGSDLHPVYHPSAHYMLGLIHYHQGQHAWAIREYEWCLDHDEPRRQQRAKALTGLVLAYRALGMESEAQRYSNMLDAG